jgi:hypothetical protein
MRRYHYHMKLREVVSSCNTLLPLSLSSIVQQYWIGSDFFDPNRDGLLLFAAVRAAIASQRYGDHNDDDDEDTNGTVTKKPMWLRIAACDPWLCTLNTYPPLPPLVPLSSPPSTTSTSSSTSSSIVRMVLPPLDPVDECHPGESGRDSLEFVWGTECMALGLESDSPAVFAPSAGRLLQLHYLFFVPEWLLY